MAIKPKADTAKAKADAPKAKVETVTLRHLGNAIAEAHELPKKQVTTILEEAWMTDICAGCRQA